MNNIQQKLKILQRIYLFNHGDISALEKQDLETHIKLIDQYSKKNYGNDFYFDPKDTRLILSSLPFNEINQIFDYIFLQLLLENSEVKLNGQILKKLSDSLLPTEIQQILDNTQFNQTSQNICQAILEYSTLQIKEHLKWLYFKGNNSKLYKYTTARFKPQPYYKQLEDMLNQIKISELVNKCYPIVLPYLEKAINNFIESGEHNG